MSLIKILSVKNTDGNKTTLPEGFNTDDILVAVTHSIYELCNEEQKPYIIRGDRPDTDNDVVFGDLTIRFKLLDPILVDKKGRAFVVNVDIEDEENLILNRIRFTDTGVHVSKENIFKSLVPTGPGLTRSSSFTDACNIVAEIAAAESALLAVGTFRRLRTPSPLVEAAVGPANMHDLLPVQFG